MNKLILKVIQNALQSDKQLFPLNQSWQYLHQNYNIGRTQGNKLELTGEDKTELLTLVKLTTGVDLEQIDVAEFATMNREDMLTIAIDEKLAGQAVKKSRLAIKPLGGHPLKINEQFYILPDYGHLDIALADVQRTTHNCLMIIENYRCFDRLASIQLTLPPLYKDPLIVYRGDSTYSENDVRQLITNLSLPVIVMADLDPKGLAIAQSFPHLVGLIAPSLNDVETLFNNPQIANRQLYTQQLAVCQGALANSPHILIRQLWLLMKTHQAGVVQEYWLLEDYPLVLHSLYSW
jgi:hypothetical protein